MSTIATNTAHHGHDHADRDLLRPENITLAPGAGRGLGLGLVVAGLVAVIAVLALGFTGAAGVTLKQALGAYLVGAMSVLAMSLGAMFFVMAFHLTNAGWTGTVRRQFENVMAFAPWAWLLMLPVLVIEIATHGTLMRWLDPALYGDHNLQVKAAYFFAPLHIVDHDTHTPATQAVFPVFFVARALLYGAVWTFLARTLMGLSRRQDENPDVTLAAKARFTSAWGMLLFALTTAFAAFDWLMSLDYKFFSTMWGVCYFAGAAYAGSAAAILVLARLRGAGKLRGVVTPEHFHDIGKLLFSFTVFWAYVSFSQYFLIWYSNIPEETAYFYYRTHPDSAWRPLGIFLMVAHFGGPFLIMLFRVVKKNTTLLSLMAAWALLAHVADIYFIVRPMVDAGSMSPPPVLPRVWVDLLGILGILAVAAGYLCIKVPASRLVAVNDPRMDEALGHRNYV